MFTGLGDEDTGPEMLTYEKFKIEWELGELIRHIHATMRDLVRERWQIPEADVVEGQEYVLYVIDQLLGRARMLNEKRFSNLKARVRRPPVLRKSPPRNHLVEEATPAFDDWWDYALSWMEIIETSLDEMGLLMTDYPPQFDPNEYAQDILSAAKEAAPTSIVEEGD